MKDKLNWLMNLILREIWNFRSPVSNYKIRFMIEINVPGPSRHKAGVYRIKKALNIDMTPMVDLGFLLISFFIFTTEISKPALTNLYMPKEGGPTKIPATKSLTLLLGGNNEVFYYAGDMTEAVKNNQVLQTSYSEISGIGFIIRQKQNELINRNINKKRANSPFKTR
jgi:biopolymer transport protein ExbD